MGLQPRLLFKGEWWNQNLASHGLDSIFLSLAILAKFALPHSIKYFVLILLLLQIAILIFLLKCFCFFFFALFLCQMAAFNIQEALIWKEKIEFVIDQVKYLIHSGNLCLLLVNSVIFQKKTKNAAHAFNKNIEWDWTCMSVAASGVTGS